MSVLKGLKKQKLEDAFNKRLERGKKKAAAKKLRQARKLKEKNNANA
jgi:hypothetical protein